MDGISVYQQLQEALEQHWLCIDQMVELANARSEADKAYRIAYRKRMLYYRDIAERPVGMLDKLVSGDEDIAELRTALDCAEALEKANNDRNMYWKRIIDTCRDLMKQGMGERSA